MVINFKLNFCRITLAAKLFAKNNFIPILKPLSPADTRRKICEETGESVPLMNHYIPVLLQRESRKVKRRRETNSYEYGKRKHKRSAVYRYVEPYLDNDISEHRMVKSMVAKKRKGAKRYVYFVDERDIGVVVSAQWERAIREGEITDMLISDRKDRMVIRLRDGLRIKMDIVDLMSRVALLEGEGITKRVIEEDHHYGKETMGLVKIFEMKEAGAAEDELEMMRLAALKKKKLEEEEMKRQAKMLADRLERERKRAEDEANKVADEARRAAEAAAAAEAEERAKNVRMAIADLSRTANVPEKLQEAGDGALKQLPLATEMQEIIRAMAMGEAAEISSVPGVKFRIGDQTKFLAGQMVKTDQGDVFVPGQTIDTGEGVQYLPGLTVNIDNIPMLFPGLIMTDDHGEAVFLPGQAVISSDGKMNIVEGRLLPPGLKTIDLTKQLEEDRLREEERRKERERLMQMERDREEQERFEKMSKDDISKLSGEQKKKMQKMQQERKERLEKEKAKLREKQRLEALERERKLKAEQERLAQEEKDKLLAELAKMEEDMAKMEETKRLNAKAAEKQRVFFQMLENKKAAILELLEVSKQGNAAIFLQAYEKGRVTSITLDKVQAIAEKWGLAAGRDVDVMVDLLLNLTYRTQGYPGKTIVNSKNINENASLVSLELNKMFGDVGYETKQALKRAVYEAIACFMEKPNDQQKALNIMQETLEKQWNEYPSLYSEIIELFTTVDRDQLIGKILELLSQVGEPSKVDTLKALAIMKVVNQEETMELLRRILHFEGELMGPSFELMVAIYPELLDTVIENVAIYVTDIHTDRKATEMLQKAIAKSVNDLMKTELTTFLENGGRADIKQHVEEAQGLAAILGLSMQESNLAELAKEAIGKTILTADLATLDVLKRITMMHKLAKGDRKLTQALKFLSTDANMAKTNPRIRELVRRSAALIHSGTIDNSLRIPQMLMSPEWVLALEDYLIQRVRCGLPYMVNRSYDQIVIPEEVTHSLLSKKEPYILVDEKIVKLVQPAGAGRHSDKLTINIIDPRRARLLSPRPEVSIRMKMKILKF